MNQKELPLRPSRFGVFSQFLKEAGFLCLSQQANSASAGGSRSSTFLCNCFGGKKNNPILGQRGLALSRLS